MMPQTRPDTSPRMVTGSGQSDTHALEITSRDTGQTISNPHPSAGKDYNTITGREIAALAANPAAEEKHNAPWIIGSTYAAHDARSHEAQREHGVFHVLPVDIDKGGHALDVVESATREIVGPQTSFIIYSSSSATAENPKWRVLFFVGGDGLPGADYKDTQNALFDLYAARGIMCDRALDRPGQLVFLPNVPPEKRGPDGQPLFYKHVLNRGGTLKLGAQSPIIQRREDTRRLVQEAVDEASLRTSRAVTGPNDELSPVDHYNATHSLVQTLERYGYQRLGTSDHWKSPNSTSGSYAVRVYDDHTWVSLSGSDQAAGIGAQKEYCCYGDAFDLFVNYEHGGDHKGAVRAYGQQIRPSAIVVPLHPATGDDLTADFGEAATPAPKTPTPGTELSEWVFLSRDNEFYHPKTSRPMSITAFNLAMSPITPKIKIVKSDGEVTEKKLPASKTLIDYLNGVVADSTMYRPDLPESGADLFYVDGVPFVNSYIPDSAPACDPDWRSKEAWKICERHIRNIMSENAAQIIISWMAHNVQFPGRKILWAPIIVGVQGDGKTTLSKMLSAAMGSKNVSAVSPESMFSEFTGWAEGSCINVLEEIRVHGNSRHNAMNKLKPLITNDQVEIVRKGKDGKQVVNVTNYLALTNHMDALALDEGDRRWGVFKTRFDDRQDMLAEFDDAYWETLHGAIHTEPGAIRAWLMSVDLSSFNRVAAPDTNEHKRAMIEETKPADQVDVEEAIAIGWHGVTPTLLATDCLNAAIQSGSGYRLASKRLSVALKQAGWTRIDGQFKWNGLPRRLWFKKGSGLGNAAPQKLREILDSSDTEGGL